jgi:hypothetical protein
MTMLLFDDGLLNDTLFLWWYFDNEIQSDYAENFERYEMPKEIKSEKFVRAWKSVKTLRSLAKQIDSSEDVLALSVTLLRYALHVMTFAHLNVNQKLWALASACVHAENIVYQMKAKAIL